MDNKNIDMATLMNLLANMDKKELENGLNKVNQVLNSGKANSIIEEIKKNSK